MSGKSQLELELQLQDMEQFDLAALSSKCASLLHRGRKKNVQMEGEPKDKYKFVFCTMCLFGVTSLLPWNFFITANEYWNYKFRDVNATESPGNTTELQKDFTSYLAIASKVPFVLFLLVNTWISQRFHASVRIGIPLVICLVLFSVTAILVYVDTDHHQYAFLAGTLCCVAAINVVAAFLQGGGTGIAGALPKQYMTSNVYGQAIGGVFASIVQILTLVGDSTPQGSALAYFLIAVATLGVTLAAFLIMIRTPFYYFYISTQIGKYQAVTNESSQERLPVKQIIGKIWVHALSTVIVFWVTLTIFPAVVVVTKSVHFDKSIPITDDLFLPVACFLNFNFCDIVGRVAATYFPLPQRRRYLLLFLCVSRVVFIPVFTFFNIPSRVHSSSLIQSDTAFCIFVSLFALTNGYLYTLAMTNGPKLVEVKYQETAGSILAFCLGAGLGLGALTSLLVLNLI